MGSDRNGSEPSPATIIAHETLREVPHADRRAQRQDGELRISLVSLIHSNRSQLNSVFSGFPIASEPITLNKNPDPNSGDNGIFGV